MVITTYDLVKHELCERTKTVGNSDWLGAEDTDTEDEEDKSKSKLVVRLAVERGRLSIHDTL